MVVVVVVVVVFSVNSPLFVNRLSRMCCDICDVLVRLCYAE